MDQLKTRGRAKEVDDAAISEAVVRFAVRTPTGSLPESAHHVVRVSLLDWTAVALAGHREPVSRIVREMAAHDGGTAEASVIGLGAKLPARAAALVNGTTSHALDYDDTHFVYLGHPSVAVLPAALAAAEKAAASAGDLLDAALIGTESACRIGAWLGRRYYEHGFHQTATAGCFGATMAAARPLGLDEEPAHNALAGC